MIFKEILRLVQLGLSVWERDGSPDQRHQMRRIEPTPAFCFRNPQLSIATLPTSEAGLACFGCGGGALEAKHDVFSNVVIARRTMPAVPAMVGARQAVSVSLARSRWKVFRDPPDHPPCARSRS